MLCSTFGHNNNSNAHNYIRITSINVLNCFTCKDLLPLSPLPITALQEPKFESLYEDKFTYFNPIQVGYCVDNARSSIN